MRTVSAILLGVAAILGAAHSEETPDAKQGFPELRFRVKVVVSADEVDKNLVQSYITRELRGFGNVDIVDERPDWVFSVVEARIKTGGADTGIVLSVTAYERFPEIMVNGFFYDSPYKDTVSEIVRNLYYEPVHWLRMGPSDSLKQLCEEIVADFDAEQMERQRKGYLEFVERMKDEKSISTPEIPPGKED